MNDKNGDRIRPKMLLLEQTGGSRTDRGCFLSFNIYFLMQTVEFDGHGWMYGPDGKPYRFSWCDPANSFIIKRCPKYFKKCVKAGMSYLDVKCESDEWVSGLGTNKDYKQIIDSSNWEEYK